MGDINVSFDALIAPLLAKISALEDRLRALDKVVSKPGIDLQGTTEAGAKVQAVQDQLEKLSGKTATSYVQIVGVPEAMSELAALDTAISQASRNVTIDVNSMLARRAALVGGIMGAQGSPGGGGGSGGGTTIVTPPAGGGDAAAAGGVGAMLGKFFGIGKSGATASQGGLGKALGIGGGMFGMAAMGSAGSLMGLGFEHVVITAAGIGASMAGGAIGGALLGAGALGTMAVGGGIDMAVSRSSMTDIKNAVQGIQSLQAAIAQYGATSYQAVQAQAALNYQMSTVPKVAQASTMQVAKAVVNMQTAFSNATGPAEKLFDQIALGAVGLAMQYVPMVGAAATRNFTLIKAGLVPLYNFFAGPFKAIFQELENIFASHLPLAMQGLTDLVEILMRTIAQTAPLTGSMLDKVVKFLNYWNTPEGIKRWHAEVKKLVELFQAWFGLLGRIVYTLILIGKDAAGLGKTVALTLTSMLAGVDQYIKSTSGSEAIKTIFTVHKAQIVVLLGLIGQLLAVGALILIHVIPPFVMLTVWVGRFAEALIHVPVVGTFLVWGIAAGFLLTKLKGLLLLPKLFGAAMVAAVGGINKGIGLLDKLPFFNIPKISAFAAKTPQITATDENTGALVENTGALAALTEAITARDITSVASTVTGVGEVAAAGLVGAGLGAGAGAGLAAGTTAGGMDIGLGAGIGDAVAASASTGVPEALAGFAAAVSLGALTVMTLTSSIKKQNSAAERFGQGLANLGANMGPAWTRFGPAGRKKPPGAPTVPTGPGGGPPGGTSVVGPVQGQGAPPGYHWQNFGDYWDLVRDKPIPFNPMGGAGTASALGVKNYGSIIKSNPNARRLLAAFAAAGQSPSAAASAIANMPLSLLNGPGALPMVRTPGGANMLRGNVAQPFALQQTALASYISQSLGQPSSTRPQDVRITSANTTTINVAGPLSKEAANQVMTLVTQALTASDRKLVTAIRQTRPAIPAGRGVY
jgi:hypothetical protein